MSNETESNIHPILSPIFIQNNTNTIKTNNTFKSIKFTNLGFENIGKTLVQNSKNMNNLRNLDNYKDSPNLSSAKQVFRNSLFKNLSKLNTTEEDLENSICKKEGTRYNFSNCHFNFNMKNKKNESSFPLIKNNLTNKNKIRFKIKKRKIKDILDLKGKKIKINKNYGPSVKLNYTIIVDSPLVSNQVLISNTSRNIKSLKTSNIASNSSLTNIQNSKNHHLINKTSIINEPPSKKYVNINLPQIIPLDQLQKDECNSTKAETKVDNLSNNKNVMQISDLIKRKINEKMIKMRVLIDNQPNYQGLYLARLKGLIERIN